MKLSLLTAILCLFCKLSPCLILIFNLILFFSHEMTKQSRLHLPGKSGKTRDNLLSASSLPSLRPSGSSCLTRGGRIGNRECESSKFVTVKVSLRDNRRPLLRSLADFFFPVPFRRFPNPGFRFIFPPADALSRTRTALGDRS